MFSCQGEVSSKVLGYPWTWTIAGRKELTYLVLCDRVVGLGGEGLKDSKVCT